MSVQKFTKILTGAMFSTLLFVGNVSAQTTTPDWFKISLIRTGWNTEAFAVVPQPLPNGTTSFLNPANCTAPDGYVAEQSSPAYKTHYQAILLAFSMDKRILITVSNIDCALGRPRIIGVTVEK